MGIDQSNSKNSKLEFPGKLQSPSDHGIFVFLVIFLTLTIPQVLCLKGQPCSNALGKEGICLFVWDCIKADGTHLGICREGPLFGSCCEKNNTFDTVINEIDQSNSADKPIPPPEVTSTSSWFNPSSFSPSSSNFQTDSWHSHPSSQASSQYPQSSSWPTQRPSPTPIASLSTSFPNKAPPSTTASPVYHQPTTTQPTVSSAPVSTPPPTTSHPPVQHLTIPSQSPGPDPGPPRPWHPVSSQGPAQVNVQQPRPPLSPPTGAVTFRPPPVFTIHRPIFFKPRPTFRPPIRPTTSIFQPFNQRPSPAPFPQFPSSFTTPAALTSTAMSTTVPSTTVATTTTTTTTEPTTSAPYSRPTPFRPNYPQITNNPSTTSSASSGSNSIVTRRPLPPHSGKYECGSPPLLPQSKVVGGKNSAFGSWPWQVSVRRTSFFGFSSTHRCGGAIINSQWIATAGHCVDE